MKRTISLILSFAMCICLLTCFTISGYALNDSEVISYAEEISEYDMIVDMKKNSPEMLYARTGSSNIENELLKIKELDAETLKDTYGLSDVQITILKEYEGTPIEDTPELRGVLSASVAASLSRTGYTSTSVSFRYYWTWSSRPMFLRTDIIGIVTNASKPDGTLINVDYSSSSATLDYYDINNSYVKTIYPSVTKGYNGNPNVIASTFAAGIPDSTYSSNHYAKTGFVYGTIVPSAPNASFGDVKMYGAYGHSIASATPTLSVTGTTVSLSIDFSYNVTKTGETFVDMY